jgi:hypothetical protein
MEYGASKEGNTSLEGGARVECVARVEGGRGGSDKYLQKKFKNLG